MKRVQISIFLAAMSWAAMAPAFAGTDKPGSGVTAGELSRDLSAVARMAGATEVSRRLITTDLGAGANAPLTEGRAVAILQNAGFAATSSSPDRVLTRDQADVLVLQFRSSLLRTAARSGSSMEISGPLDTIDSCFDARNHGQCVDCCKALGGGPGTCAKTCMTINKPSDSEPIP